MLFIGGITTTMKKISIIMVGFLLTIPLIGAVSSTELSKQHLKGEKLTTLLNEPPEWATHYFRGVLGITNQYGRPVKPNFFLVGYCTESFSGRFIGAFTQQNHSEPLGYLTGRTNGPILIGRISGGDDQESAAGIVGIGVHNKTHFYFRFIGLRGPSLYMAGIYSPLEKTI